MKIVCIAVDPVVQGKTRAEQHYNNDKKGKHVCQPAADVHYVCLIVCSNLGIK